MSVTIRPYQREAIEAVKRDWSAGYTDVLGVLSTGGGKTVVFLQLLVEELARHPGARALILCHRMELITQPLERLGQFWPEWALRAGIVMAETDQCDRQITAATVQTLAQPERLSRLLVHGAIDYLIRDECHRATTETDTRILAALRERNPQMRHLGVTATPIRADGHGMIEVYQKESFHYGIREMVKAGWLVPPRWLAIQTGISLKGVAKRDGDYSAKSLADVFETRNCHELVVESYRKYAEGRPALAFTANVDSAYRLAERFSEAGIKAEAADGGTAKRDRTAILRDFRAGKTQILVNCQLWTEGLDLPQVSCILQVRPTKSDGAYIQMVGRGLRTAPGKEDCTILDFAPLEARNICMLGDVLGVDARKDVYIRQGEDVEEGEVIGGFTFDGTTKWLTGDPVELISRELNYLDLSPWSWHRSTDGWLSLGLGKASDNVERTLAISPVREDGLCSLWGIAKREGERYPRAYLIRKGEFESLSEHAEQLCDKWGNATLASKGRKWMKESPTEAQLTYAKRLGIDTRALSKGQLAARITATLARKAVGRYAA